MENRMPWFILAKIPIAMKKITILVTDDHTLVRQTWSMFLNADPRFQVVAEAGSAEEAIEKTNQLRPNIVIMDINLPGMSGIEATSLIRKFSPATKVLGVSMYSQPTYALKMLKHGALGYVTKSSSCEELYMAITEVQNKRKYICREVRDILTDQMISEKKSQGGVNALSPRELEIIGLLKKGYSSKEIANSLMVSTNTVDVHRYNILRKLNVKNTAAVINCINKNQLGVDC